MSEFQKTKLVIAFGLIASLVIIIPIVNPTFEKISVNIFATNIKASSTYYLMICTFALSVFIYGILFVQSGKFERVKIIADFLYTLGIALPFIFCLVWITIEIIIPVSVDYYKELLSIIIAIIVYGPIFIIIKRFRAKINKVIENTIENIKTKDLDDIFASNSKIEPGYHIWKRTIDIYFGVLFVIMMLPVLVTISILIKVTSKGPIFLPNYRIGKDKKEFKLYRFRTLKSESENVERTDNTNVTFIGKILILLSLDVIPLFLNLLLGDVSLFGVHPLKPNVESNYFQDDKTKDAYYSVKPGIITISGLFQIPIEKSLAADIYYVQNKSMMLEIALWVSASKVSLPKFKLFGKKS